MNKESVGHAVLPLLAPNDKEKVDQRGLPVPPLLQILIALRYYGAASIQIICGDVFGCHQTTVCRIVQNILRIIAGKMSEYITFPPDLHPLTVKFVQMKGFLNVVGAIDCTHIPIQNPCKELGKIFQNRKGYFSLNVQAVVGPDMEILDLVCRWPGSAYDSRIFRDSTVNHRFENKEFKGILIGDSGYPQLSYLFTPVLKERRVADIRYNVSHRGTRNIIERTFGVWKRRFPCLSKKMATNLQNTRYIIAATAILHNIAVKLRDNYEEFPEIIDEQPDLPVYTGPHSGSNVQKINFINQFFT